MECISEKNRLICNCTYEPCPKKYKYCECMGYYRKNNDLLTYYFNMEFKRTYDRSISDFLRMM